MTCALLKDIAVTELIKKHINFGSSIILKGLILKFISLMEFRTPTQDLKNLSVPLLNQIKI